MYATINDVKRVTGYEVSQETLNRAQTIIEVHTGRIESEVVSPKDKAMLGRATCFQAAYMRDNSEQIYEQVMVSTAGQNDSLVTYKAGDTTAPWIAPLAVMACKRLSWLGSRSIKTGRVFQRRGTGYFSRASYTNWWND